MKVWTSPKLYLSRGNDWREVVQGNRWWMCAAWLRRHFELPKPSPFIWVTVGVDPSPNRVAVEFRQLVTIMGRIVGANAWLGMYRNFAQALATHFGPRLTSGPLYLGLLYEG